MRTRSAARAPGVESSESSDDTALDLVDVPAAVVCAGCGNPDCPGCVLEEPTHASGVVAIVPWERPGLGFWIRLWSTARLATTRARSFFGSLPEGELSSALGFALVCEALAVAGLALSMALVIALFFPELPRLLLQDRVLSRFFARCVASGMFALVLFMVLMHALHGVALDFAARKCRGLRPGRGLRFGLYTCGWDLVTLPVGLLVLALLEGPRAARRAAPLGVTAPMHAAEAYLVGVRGVAPEAARAIAHRALRFLAVPLFALFALLAAGAILVTSLAN